MNDIYEKLLNYLHNDFVAGSCDEIRYNRLKEKLEGIVNDDRLKQRLVSLIKEKSENTYPQIGLVTAILSSFGQKSINQFATQKQAIDRKTSKPYDTVNKKRPAVNNDLQRYPESNESQTAQIPAQSPRQVKVTEARKVTPKKLEFYFTLPDPMGFFWDDKKSLEQKSDSFFKLTQDGSNPKVGRLTLLNENEKTVKVLLSNPNMYLKPVCKAESDMYNGNALFVLKAGSAELKNGKWHVSADNKLLIKIQ